MNGKIVRRGGLAFVGLVAAALLALAATAPPVHLPFLGNITTFGLSKTDATVLLRQPDCSISQLSFYPTHLVATQTNFQTTLHQLAGLTTTAGTFAHGCHDPVLGVPSRDSTYVGLDSAGLYEAVQAALLGNDLVVYAGSASKLTYKSTTLATNVYSHVLAVDLNHDGFADIIAAGVTDATTHAIGIGVFISNGDSTYKPGVVYPLTTLGGVAFVIDDVNGDGVPDILVPNTPSGGAGQLTVLLGRGDGSFSTGPSSAMTVSRTLVTGDFNGDGKKDVVTSDGMLYLGAGDGSFSTGTTAIPAGAGSLTLAVGDFNGDAKADLAVVPLGGGVVIYQGHGDGTFTQGKTYASIQNFPASMVATDLDGDGNVDLVLGRNSNGEFAPAGDSWLYQVMMGHGDGTFAGAPVTPNPRIGIANGLQFQVPSANWFATADFDGDGHVDLLAPQAAVGTGPAGISVSAGTGDGNFGAAVASAMTFIPAVVAGADLNADGKIDAVGAGYTAAQAVVVGVLFGNGDKTLGGELDYPLPAGSGTPSGVVTGDFNGDGFQDIAVALAGGPLCPTCTTGVYVLFGQANHTFTAPVSIDASTLPIIAAGDLNADGRTDLVVADVGLAGGSGTHPPGVIRAYLANADKTFTANVPTLPTSYFSTLTLADLNKDGKLDIVAGASDSIGGNNYVVVLLGQGNGAFGTANRTKIGGGVADPPPIISVGDYDGDGNPDVAFFLPGDFGGILYGAGDGTLPNQKTLGLYPGLPGSAVAVDLNGDNKIDMLVADLNVGGVISYVNLTGLVTTGSVGTSTSLSVAPNPAAVGASVVFTATVAASAGGPATGTVSFLDDASVFGTASVSAQGVATLSSTSLRPGTHQISAQYGGDANFASSTSAAQSVVVGSATPSGDFAIAANPATGSAAAGQSATTTLTITPDSSFSGAVSLSCSGLPTGASCSFAPASVDVAGAAVTSTLTISTAVRTAQLSTKPTSGFLDPWLPTGTVLAGLGVPIVALRRGRSRDRGGRARRPAKTRMLLGLMLIGVAIIQGCNGHDHSVLPVVGGTPAGTYTVTLTATSGSISHTLPYVLTVT